jgi:microsomal epoxide hydrolase
MHWHKSVTMIEPFRVEIPSGTIADLRRRLDATRWPGGVSDSGGVPLSEMRAIAHYWLEKFDWAAQERDINRLSHFRADLGGLHLHYIHMKSARPDARPLLLLHGWPGSFVEMLAIVPMLTEWFHVVVPSLPGYGFSDAPSSAGMSNERVAGLFAELMTGLGYDRFAVQGGDWGAGIATWLAVRFPSRVIGLHPVVVDAVSGERGSDLLAEVEVADAHRVGVAMGALHGLVRRPDADTGDGAQTADRLPRVRPARPLQ